MALGLLVALLVIFPPMRQMIGDWRDGRGVLPAFEPLMEGLGRAFAAAGPRAANRALLQGIEASENRLEEESWLRIELLPPTQWLMTAALGLGNEQALAGMEGEWFYADDFEYSVGRGFLAQRVLERRRRDEGVQPDPVAAIRSLAARLAARDVLFSSCRFRPRPRSRPGRWPGEPSSHRSTTSPSRAS